MRMPPIGDVTSLCFFHASEFRFENLVSCFLRMFAWKSPPAPDIVSDLRYIYGRLFISTSGGWTCFENAHESRDSFMSPRPVPELLWPSLFHPIFSEIGSLNWLSCFQ